MKELPEHELLSACLDGELTADEQARVEQLLADSPEARQRLDELRALSGALQALPAYRVNEDLSPRVLRVAERRMLSEPSVLPAAAPAETSPAVERSSIGRQLSRPRTWLWPAVAVAAALLMWFRGVDVAGPPAEPKLAMAPKAEAPAAEPPSIQARRKQIDATAPAERPASDMLVGEVDAEKKDAGVKVLAREPAAPAASPAPPPAAAPQMAFDRPREEAMEAAGKAAPLTFKAAKTPEAAKAEQQPLLVVQCRIAGNVSKQRIVQEILATEQSALADADRMDKSKPGVEGGRKVRQSKAPQATMKPASDGSVEFSATRSELLALLAKLKARTDLFVSVPEPGELGLLESNANVARQAFGSSSGQRQVELLKQQAQENQQFHAAEPTYRVRVELQVASDAATVGRPAKPSSATSSPSQPADAPAKGSR